MLLTTIPLKLNFTIFHTRKFKKTNSMQHKAQLHPTSYNAYVNCGRGCEKHMKVGHDHAMRKT